jgi:hypothetical protein
MEENKDQKQFLMDLGKSAEEAVQRMQGFEENYYYFLQRSMQAVAWPLNFDFAEAAHRYANQDFGAALEFARELQNAEDFQDAARLQTKSHSLLEYILESSEGRHANICSISNRCDDLVRPLFTRLGNRPAAGGRGTAVAKN